MIDLSRTRDALLAEIEAAPSGGSRCDITDPEVLHADAEVQLRGHSRGQLFSLLRVTLSERFAAVPRPVLIRDLLMPLRHALGNAYKHGNGRDRAKGITVDLVLTSTGVLIAVSDEGSGFDVGTTVERLRRQGSYFVNQGDGFRAFDRARSTVTWQDGGRTLLLCFRSAPAESDDALEHLASASLAGPLEEDDAIDAATLNRALDPAWIRECLAQDWPELRAGSLKLESCHAYLGRGAAGDDCGVRYVLRVTKPGASERRIRLLIGRLHRDEARATADFEAAAALRVRQGFKGLRIPEPVRVTVEPRLVLYDFDPWMNLWQYLDYRDSPEELRRSARRVGLALAVIHRGEMPRRPVESDPVARRFQAMVAGAETALGRLFERSDVVDRFRDGVRRARDELHGVRPRSPVPIHGALGWDRIHYGVDGVFYFFGFEDCHRSDPAIDLGGFAADLLRLTLARDDAVAYRVCCDELLTSYDEKAESPIAPAELPLYVVLALGERLRDARTKAQAEHLLAAMDAAVVLGRHAG